MEEFKNFDTWVSADNNTKMTAWVNGLLPGRIILAGAYDEASKYMTSASITAL